jgi:hypothetical protein
LSRSIWLAIFVSSAKDIFSRLLVRAMFRISRRGICSEYLMSRFTNSCSGTVPSILFSAYLRTATFGGKVPTGIHLTHKITTSPRRAPKGKRLPRPARDAHAQGHRPLEKEQHEMSKPTHRAYSVTKTRGQGCDYWLNIGVCFAHEDKDGFNLLLQALPLDGKIVLRTYKEDEEEEKGKASHKKK